MGATQQFEEAACAFVRQGLRQSEPYMEHAAIDCLSEAVQELVKKAVKAQSLDRAGRTGFLDLPPELRNRIYELSLVSSERANRHASYGSVHVGYRLSPQCRVDCMICKDQDDLPDDRSKPPALLRVSRQVRREALPVYYGANVFFAYLRMETWDEMDDYDAETHIENWLASIGSEQVVMVQRLELLIWKFKPRMSRELKVFLHSLPSTGISINAVRCFEVDENTHEMTEITLAADGTFRRVV